MNKQKRWKKFEGKLVEVEWLDACNKTISFSTINNIGPSGKELLAVNNTYGKLHKVFDDIIVILTEISTDDDPEIIVVPIDWIISIK